MIESARQRRRATRPPPDRPPAERPAPRSRSRSSRGSPASCGSARD